MKKLVLILNLLAVFGLFESFLDTKNAVANCAGGMPLEQAQQVMQERWQVLQNQTDYPWGNTNIYDSLQGDRITLNPSFESLSGSQKTDALNLLQLNGLPFNVYAHDGRIVSAYYDGCTRFHTLTEKARYSWYFNERGRSLSAEEISIEDLRNTGNPAWRKVKVPISVENEQKVRLLFWEKIGYNQVKNGFWIAWVPEHGYFEINVPENYDLQQLGTFWGVAPRQYLYKVIDPNGTLKMDATFDCDRC